MSTTPWLEPASALKQLQPRPIFDPDPKSIPLGSAEAMLGPRLTADELFDEDQYRDEDYPLLSRVVAYQVLPLIGAVFAAKVADDITPALEQLFSERMPGLSWVIHDDWAGPFAKYSIVHGSLLAPPHPLTKEPMALELFGEANDGLVTLRFSTFGENSRRAPCRPTDLVGHSAWLEAGHTAACRRPLLIARSLAAFLSISSALALSIWRSMLGCPSGENIDLISSSENPAARPSAIRASW